MDSKARAQDGLKSISERFECSAELKYLESDVIIFRDRGNLNPRESARMREMKRRRS